MFRETQIPPDGLWVITADGSQEFTSVNDRRDLERLLARTSRYALLVCVHSWSNYSRDALQTLSNLSVQPEANDVAFGLHSLENAHQLEHIDPDCYRRFEASPAEPALFLFDHHVFTTSWFGKDAMREFQMWLKQSSPE